MPPGEETPATTDAGQGRQGNLEDQLRSTPVDDPGYDQLLTEYVNAAFEDILRGDEFGAEYARPAIKATVFDELVPRVIDDQTRTRLETLIDNQLDALERGTALTENVPPLTIVHQLGEPVMAFDGQFVHEVTDIRINGGGIAFVLTRSYRNQLLYAGPFGINWSHAFDLWLRVSDQLIHRVTSGLREAAYSQHPRFGEAGFNYWIPPDGEHGIILEHGDSFVWRAPNGVRHLYEQDSSVPVLHRVGRIEDRHGNFLAFGYDDQLLSRVEVNHPDRRVTFGYDEFDRVASVSDYTGRTWRYGYDDHGDLVEVVTPATDRNPSGVVTCYEYSSSQFGGAQHNLMRILDGEGQVALENDFGTDPGRLSLNRVVAQRQGGGESFFEYEDVIQEFDFDYPEQQRPAHQTTVTDRNGHPVHLIFNRIGNLIFREESILDQGRLRTLTWRYRYNRDGLLTGVLSPEGVVSQYLYGREAFVRQSGVDDEDDPALLENLTDQVRQGFGRLLAVVRRGRPYGLAELNLARGLWGDIFPDVFLAAPEDVVAKFTYEPVYGQLNGASDPRFTESADPEHMEPPEYQATLTTVEYSGPDGDVTRLLDRIVRPAPMMPDGTSGAPVIDRFPLWDERGRLRRYVDPGAVVTEYDYFGPEDPRREGHLRRSVVDPNGLAVTTAYDVDDLGRLRSVTLPRAAGAPPGMFVTSIVYNELDQVVQLTSSPPSSVAIRRFFDRNGNLEREERDARDEDGADVAGAPEVQTFAYDPEGNLVRATIGGQDPAGHLVVTHRYDRAGDRILTVQPRGNRVRTVYGERRLPVAWTAGAGSPEASTTRLEYDGDGRVRRTNGARGHATAFARDALGRVTAIENALGTVARRSYDKLGNVTVERVFEAAENGSHRMLARAEFTYDELGRVIGSGSNSFDEPLAAVDLDDDFLASPGPGELLTTRFFADVQDRMFTVVDRLGERHTHEYDTLYRVERETDPLGNQIENRYDGHSNLLRRDLRDLVHDPITGEVTGERCFVGTATYDELDRLVGSSDSLGNRSEHVYDSRGHLVRTVDPLGNVRRAEYDLVGRMVRETWELTDSGLGGGAPLGTVETAYEYDPNSNLEAVTDARGHQTTHAYDALDRHTSTVYPDGTSRSFDYDLDGNLIRAQDPNGLRLHFLVDALGRRVRTEVDRSGLPPGVEVEGVSFEACEYDGLGRRLVEENDFARCELRLGSLGWPLGERVTFTVPGVADPGPLEISRSFDTAGRLDELTYPGGRTVRHHRDGLGRLVRLENLVTGADYPGDPATPGRHDLAGLEYAGRQRIRLTMHNGATTGYRHDGAGRIVEIAHDAAGDSLLTVQYLHDAVGNPRLRNDLQPGGNASERFGYDSLYRLADVDELGNQPPFDAEALAPAGAPPPDQLPDRQAAINALIGPLRLKPAPTTFGYDEVGNRLAEQLPAGSLPYTVNDLDQYSQRGVTAFAYDRNGNLLSDGLRGYRYDANNRLVRVFDQATGATVSGFSHDARGRRAFETRDGQATHLLHNGPVLIAEYRDGTLFAQYINDGGPDRPLQIAVDGAEHAYHADLVGSVRLLTGRDGQEVASYRYSAFGRLDAEAGGTYNPLRYTGRRLDTDLGTYDFRTRQYHPELGRFLQRDPAGMADGTNLYAYAGNNPLLFGDPFGTSRTESSADARGAPVSKMVHGGRQAVRGAIAPGDEFAIGLGEIKSDLSYRQGVLQLSQRADVPGNTALVLYDHTGRVRMQIFAKDAADVRRILRDVELGGVRSLPGGTPGTRAFGDAMEPIVREMAEAYTGQSFAHKHPNAGGPDLVPIRSGRGMFLGGLTAGSGALNIYSASQVDNPFVQTIGIAGGGTELGGGVLYTIGHWASDPRLVSWGSKAARFGGGIGVAVVSGYNLIGDIERGDVQNGVGDAGSTATGVLILIGSAPAAAVAGTFTVAYEGTRLIDEPLGISDELSDRGVRVENIWQDKIGGPDWLSHGAGFAASAPVIGIGVEGIGWGVYGVKKGGQAVGSAVKAAYNFIKFW
jgi:RHS repeat-associated protein